MTMHATSLSISKDLARAFERDFVLYLEDQSISNEREIKLSRRIPARRIEKIDTWLSDAVSQCMYGRDELWPHISWVKFP
jgi:hypothetical protein